MNDNFAGLIAPVFRYVIETQDRLGLGEQPALAEVRENLVELLAEAQQAASAKALEADFELARYALVYWIDEILINSKWAYASDWRDHILEWEFFRDRLGGEQFYEKAREASARSDTDPLEVFLICVALGFRGALAGETEALRTWAENAHRRISSANPPAERFLPEEPRGDDPLEGPLPLRPLPGKSILLAVSVLVSATALVTLLAFIVAVQWAQSF
jgi:type VI secretion system protein ImpK